jgi:nickel/cobalt transporter (NiCoT) family protein
VTPGRTARRGLAPLIAALGLLHAAGWGLFAYYSLHYQALAGLGLTAYLFGVRHAFDADHIAAIDNTTRKLLQEGKRETGIGFFFSLGHSTIVLLLTVILALATRSVNAQLPLLQEYGGYVGSGASATFLWLIGTLNLLVLLDLLHMRRQVQRGARPDHPLDATLRRRGAMSRIFGRCFRLIDHGWQMYPLGMLFGLGLDTATEIGLLALAAGIATRAVPFLAILSLPLLFAAGMSLMDTLDGLCMSRAYEWAFQNPLRRVNYNVTVTGASVVVAFAVGAVELLQLWRPLGALDPATAGYGIVALFGCIWVMSFLLWKTRRPAGDPHPPLDI